MSAHLLPVVMSGWEARTEEHPRTEAASFMVRSSRQPH
jgi:hypothetical protein